LTARDAMAHPYFAKVGDAKLSAPSTTAKKNKK